MMRQSLAVRAPEKPGALLASIGAASNRITLTLGDRQSSLKYATIRGRRLRVDFGQYATLLLLLLFIFDLSKVR